MRGSIQTRRRHLLENFTRSIITPEKIGVCFGVSVKILKLICRQQIKFFESIKLNYNYIFRQNTTLNPSLIFGFILFVAFPYKIITGNAHETRAKT